MLMGPIYLALVLPSDHHKRVIQDSSVDGGRSEKRKVWGLELWMGDPKNYTSFKEPVSSGTKVKNLEVMA